jgi:hypothetical protein
MDRHPGSGWEEGGSRRAEKAMSDFHSVVRDHRIHLFFDFRFDRKSDVGDRLTKLKLQEVALRGWFHPDRSEHKDAPVWEWADWGVSSDLHPYVRSILDSRPYEGRTGSADDRRVDKARILRTSQFAVNLLAGVYRHAAPEPDTAAGRYPQRGMALADHHPLVPVRISEISVHLFRTGTGIAVVSLHLTERRGSVPIDPRALVETLPLLCDERRNPPPLSWREIDSARFSLRDIVGHLIGNPSHATVAGKTGCRLAERERTYSYCALQVAGPPESEWRDIAVRLSRHYNYHYRLPPDFTGTELVEPFANALHVASREGGCALVNVSEPAPDYLKGWLSQSHAQVYLPLQIAALHEHVNLLEMAQGIGIHIDPSIEDERHVEELRALNERFLLFRLRYRMAQVSRVTQHNLVYGATETALGLTALGEKIGRDLTAVEHHLIDVEENLSERRAAFLNAAVSGGLAYLVISNVFQHIWEGLRPFHPGVVFHGLKSDDLFSLASLVVALFFALVAFRYAWRRARSGYHHERSSPEAAHRIEAISAG